MFSEKKQDGKMSYQITIDKVIYTVKRPIYDLIKKQALEIATLKEVIESKK